MQAIKQRVIGLIETYAYPTYLSEKHLQMVPSYLARWGSAARVLNLGGKSQQYGPNVVSLDLEAFIGVDLCADGHTLPFADDSFDAVLCIAVFEHLYHPWQVAAEIARVLKPGGEFYMEVPFMQPYHADPTDYFRYTLPGLEALFERFEKLDSGVICGAGSTLAWMLALFTGITFDRHGDLATSRTRPQSRGYWFGTRVGQVLFTWLKYLDHWLDRREHTFVMASGFYFAGRLRT